MNENKMSNEEIETLNKENAIIKILKLMNQYHNKN